MKTLLTNESVKNIVVDIAKRLSCRISSGRYVVLTILDGGATFSHDLLTEVKTLIHNSTQFDLRFIKVERYVGNMPKKESNELKDSIMLSVVDILGIGTEPVIVVDDICDSGFTLETIRHAIETYSERDIITISLLKRSTSKYTPDIFGIEMNVDDYVYGYGMDLEGRNRDLNKICTL